ncbi:MAG: signal peptidase I [candidate division Zixibacteria bacterium]|nr:signal peptidase I [candidate division Zixibacteria bacterium]
MESEASQTAEQPRVSAQKSLLREYMEIIVFAVALFGFIRTDVVQAFRIPSGSMENTLLIGDFLLVNKFIYGPRVPFTDIRLPGLRDPRPGDVVVFPFPQNPEQDFIKRCIAVEGQTIEIRDKVVYVDGVKIDNPQAVKFDDPSIKPASRNTRDNFGPKIVPQGHLFVMGDNRDYSHDSRYWGFVDQETVIGNAFIVYWSWDRKSEDPELTWSGSNPVESVVSLAHVVGYNIVHIPWRVRWGRIADLID